MSQDPHLQAFFEDGFYEEYWAPPHTDAISEREAQQVLRLLGATHGHILDWRGGWGRHAICFARSGFQVTILDFVQRFLERARQRFRSEGLEVETVCADCRQTPPGIQADFATCLMNSIGFLEPREEIEAFKSLQAAIRPGGKLLLDCMNLLFIGKAFNPLFEMVAEDGTVYRSHGNLDLTTNVLHKTFEIERPDGSVVSNDFAQTMYTPHDLSLLISEAGFVVERIFGSYGGEPIALGSEKIVLLASKE
jgi:SAM-dependent methyltransferase